VTESTEPDLGRLEIVIGRLLRAGVLASSLCLACGLILTIAGISRAMAEMALSAGLLVLLATPVARVIVSVTEYLRERDWMFVWLTLGVLLALAGSAVAAFWR
jgi:uncharacterized membrane protein